MSNEQLRDVINITNKKSIHCPGCRIIFLSSNEGQICLQPTDWCTIVKILCGLCTNPGIKKSPVFLCLSCDRHNRRMHKICKCEVPMMSFMNVEQSETINDLGCATITNGSDDIADVQAATEACVGDCPNDMFYGIEGNADFDDTMVASSDNDFLGIEEGKADSYLGNHHIFAGIEDGGADSEDHSVDVGEFNARDFFKEKNGWSKNSCFYFIHQHETSHGLKAMVYETLVDLKGDSNFDDISNKQASYTLHAVSNFYQKTKTETIELCTIIDQLRKKHEEDVNQLKLNYRSAVRSVLATNLNPSEIDHVWTQITSQAMMNGHQKSKAYIPEVLEEKDVRRYYTQGPNSFVSILPHPDVTTRSIGSCKFAYINAEQTFNHLLGHGFQCHYFCAGYDDDWCA